MKVAAIQMISNAKIEENLLQAEQLIQQAVQQHAQLIVLPENFAFMGNATEILNIVEPFGKGIIQNFIKNQSVKYKVYIVGGSIPLLSENSHKAYASCLVFNPQGTCIAKYNKIHLFDVQIPEKNEYYKESDTYGYGKEIITCETELGKLGIGICYDMRFPELFRLMQLIDFIVIPAAFTYATGKAHWEILLRARAIENQTFVIAANQGGTHYNGRETFGHSMIIDPWGKILACIEKGQGIAIADCDLNEIQNLRTIFPVLKHRQIYEQTF